MRSCSHLGPAALNEKMLPPNPALNLTAPKRRFALLLGTLRACGAPAAG